MAFRLGALSEGLAGDIGLAVEVAVEVGLDGLDLRRVQCRDLHTFSETEVREMDRVIKAGGLTVQSLNPPFGRDFYIDDDSAKTAHEGMLEISLRYAQILGAPMVRIFAPWKPDHANYLLRPDFSQCLPKLVDVLTPSVRMAERAGLQLIIETEPDAYAGQVKEARQLIEALGSRHVGLCYDVVNGWRAGENPWPTGYAYARGLVRHVQLKDRKADAADPRLPNERAVLGEGDVPWVYLLRELGRDGYDGYVSVERIFHEPRWPEREPALRQAALADIQNARRLMELAEQLP